MIQRIQTIYLLLAALGNFGLGALPWAVSADTAEAGIFADGQFTATDHTGLIAGLIAAGAVALMTIFLFKQRKVQVKLAAVSLVLTLLATAFAVWLFLSAGASAQVQPGAVLVLPVAIFAILAMRYIRKDDKLVRSMDRLR
jgi:hypothetical protein